MEVKWIIYNNLSQFQALNNRLHNKLLKQGHKYKAKQFASIKSHPSNGKVAMKICLNHPNINWTEVFNELTPAEKNKLTDLTPDWIHSI